MKKELIAELNQIDFNYNMGFATKREYYCQRAYTKASYGGHFWQFLWWKMLCITPKFIFNLV